MFKKVIGKVCRNGECDQKDKIKEDFLTVCDCGQALEEVTATDKKKTTILAVIILLLLIGGGYAGVLKLKARAAATVVDTTRDVKGVTDGLNNGSGGAGGATTQSGNSISPQPVDAKGAIQLVSNGLNLAKENKLQEAEVAFRTASEKDPTNDQVFGNLGAVCSALGKNDEALSASLKAISLNPNNSIWHLNAAELYSKKGDKDKALSQLELAINCGFNQKDKIKAFNFKSIENDQRFKTLMEKM